jgi:hypothetical protein
MSARRQKPIDFAAEGLRLALSVNRNCGIRVHGRLAYEESLSGYGDRAFVFMGQKTVVTEARAAVGTIELIRIKNFISAFCAFDTAVD